MTPQQRSHPAGAALIACGLFALSACSVSGASDLEGGATRNECSTSADCPGGYCLDGACAASGGELSTVLFEIIPPSDAAIAGVSFLKQVDGLPTGGGNLNIELGHMARAEGRVTASSRVVPSKACPPEFMDPASGLDVDTAADGSLPVRLVLTPSEQVLGLSTATYAVAALPEIDAGNVILPDSFAYSVDLPAGNYDIYVEPLAAPPGASCIVPPQLYRRQQIDSGKVPLDLDLLFESLERLALKVEVPVGQPSLSGWTVDMIDPVSGRIVSNRVVLGVPAALGDLVEYTAELVFFPVIGEELPQEMLDAGAVPSAVDELVRLIPPDDVTAPSIVLARSGLDLFDMGVATIQLPTLPSAVEVEGQVQSLSGSIPEGATVTMIATEIAGLANAIPASFIRSVDALAEPEHADDPIKFSVALLPGKYLVHAVPPAGSGLAATDTTWDIAASASKQYGKVIELGPSASIIGSAFDSRGSGPVIGASVQAVASLSMLMEIQRQDRAFYGSLSLVPRSSTDLVGEQGTFELETDPGAFDVSVRALESSGFAWLLQPNVDVPTAGRSWGILGLPLPVVYQGFVTIGSEGQQRTNVPNALIRAYLYLDNGQNYTSEPAENAKSVLQIAETRADDKGHFKLLLPERVRPVSN